MAQNIPELYGSLVFNDKVMRSKLPKDMYKALKKTIESGTHLELDVANSVAVAMKEHSAPTAEKLLIKRLLSFVPCRHLIKKLQTFSI